MQLGERFEEQTADGKTAVATVEYDADQGTPHLQCDDGHGKRTRRAATEAELAAWREAVKR